MGAAGTPWIVLVDIDRCRCVVLVQLSCRFRYQELSSWSLEPPGAAPIQSKSHAQFGCAYLHRPALLGPAQTARATVGLLITSVLGRAIGAIASMGAA
jgi:hypothetical protein